MGVASVWAGKGLAVFNRFRRHSTAGVVGIDVHPDGVALVHVVDETAGPRVVAWEFLPCVTEQARNAVLEKLAKDYQLKRHNCTTVLAPTEYRLLVADAPNIPDMELAAAMRWRVKDLLDFDVDEAVVDVFDFPVPDGALNSRPLYVVAARRAAIRQRTELLESAGVALKIVDIPEMAMRNVASLLPNAERGVAFLVLYLTRGVLTVSKGTTLYVSRELPIGLDALLEATDRGAQIDNIITEVRRSLDYFASHFRQDPVDRVMLGPVPFDLPGWEDYLAEHLGLPVETVELNELARWDREVPQAFQGKCVSAFGAALRVVTESVRKSHEAAG